MPLLSRPTRPPRQAPEAAIASFMPVALCRRLLLLASLGFATAVDTQASPSASRSISPQDQKAAPTVSSHCLLQRATSFNKATSPQLDRTGTEVASLVAVDSNSSRSERRGEAGRQSTGHAATLNASTKTKDVPASWFGDFSHGESTWDVDGVGDYPDYPERIAARVSESGNSVNMEADELPGYMGRDGLPSEWFEESVSGGHHAAWRTRFPPLEAFRSEAVRTVPWLPDPNGRRQKTQMPAASSIAEAFHFSARKQPAWFDQSIQHYDDFGRNRPPSELSDRRYWDWKKEHWEVEFGCPDPNCTASFNLPKDGGELFDAKTTDFAKCSLSIGVHPTDYDDEYSREHVEWFKVNDHQLVSFCDPMAKVCNQDATDKRGVHPCVSDYPIDQLLRKTISTTSSTKLEFSGKISDMVDECPVNSAICKGKGCLLSGRANVTCFTRPKLVTTPPPPPAKPDDAVAKERITPLNCSERGCVAKAIALVNRLPQDKETCKMTLKAWHTDFDNKIGDAAHPSKEVIEWVKVNGKEIDAKKWPGKVGRNPCKEVELLKKAPTKESVAEREAAISALEPLSPDAQTRAMLAPLPEDAMTGTNCRRRTLAGLFGQDSSQIHRWDNFPAHRRRGAPNKRRDSGFIDYNHQGGIDYNHLRAAPDEPEDVTGSPVDITKEVKDGLSAGSVVVEAKISDMVDECGKDGYLLNGLVIIKCGP